MKALYILGNGFDLAHGLKTSYLDFRRYLESCHLEFLLEFEKMYGIHPLDNTEYGYTEALQKEWNDMVNCVLWKDFEERIGKPDFQDMIDFSDSILNDMDLDGGNSGIDDTIDYYWKQQYGFAAKFSEYVKEWISCADLTDKTPIYTSIINDDTDLFLSFNYTGTLEEIYKIPNENILHIHGGLEPYSDISPIMGHGNIEDINKYLSIAKEKSAINNGESCIYRAIVDYLSGLYKDVEFNIKVNDGFFNKLKRVNEVIIFGTSLAPVDSPYIKRIKELVASNTRWVVYYYDDYAKNLLEAAICGLDISDANVDFKLSEEWK